MSLWGSLFAFSPIRPDSAIFMGPSSDWRRCQDESVVYFTLSFHKFCCFSVVCSGCFKTQRGVGPIPDTVAACFEAWIMPKAALDSCYNQSIFNSGVANIRRSLRGQLHDNAALQLVKVTFLGIQLSTISFHSKSSFQSIRESGSQSGSFLSLT